MGQSLTWLRPHFERIMEEYWQTTQLAYRLYPQRQSISYDDVGTAIQRLLGDRPDVSIRRLDLAYSSYPKAIFEEIIQADRTNLTMPWPERNDCDNYGWRFKCNMDFFFNADAVGFVLDESAWHAYNLIVLPDLTAELFEPQQDRFVALDEPIVIPGGVPLAGLSTGRYSLTKGLIII